MSFARQILGRWGLLLCLVGFVWGCAQQRTPDWKSRIGIATYDDVLLEMGPPNHVATLQDGGRVAEWLLYSSRIYSVPGTGYGPYGPWYGGGWVGPTVNTTPNVYLLLTFGPDQKLVSVRHQYK